MASRDQNLRIKITGDSGDLQKSFKEVISIADSMGVTVTKQLVSINKAGETVSNTVTVVGRKLAALEKSLADRANVNTAFTDNFEAQDASIEREKKARIRANEEVLRAKVTRAKAADQTTLVTVQRRLALERIISENGATSIQAFRAAQANKLHTLQINLENQLASHRKRLASGEITTRTQQRARKTDVVAYGKAVSKINKETDTANKRELAQNALLKKQNDDITAAKRKQKTSIDKQVTGIRSVVRAHRSWTLQIAEGIGLYRAVSFAISGISRAILAVPKIGIERQTTEAVFNATLGGQVGSDQAFAAIAKEAQRTGIAIDVLRETFRNLNASMTLAGESSATAFKVFTDLNTVSTALHLSGEKTSSVFAAIAQIFNKSKVQSEELVKQLGNLLPGAFASFQKANEKVFPSVQDLTKQLSLGNVAAHELIATFTGFLSKRFQSGFDLAVQGLQVSLGKMETNFIELGEAVFKVTKGPMTAFINILGKAAIGIKGIVEGTSVLGDLFRGAVSIGIGLLSGKLFTLGKRLLGAKVAIGTTTVAGIEIIKKVKLFSWANRATVAVVALKGALKLLGGVPGVVITGLILMGNAIANIGAKSRKTAKDIKDLIQENKDLIANENKKSQVPTLEIALQDSKSLQAKRKVIKAFQEEIARDEARAVAESRTQFAKANKEQIRAKIEAKKKELVAAKEALVDFEGRETDAFNIFQKQLEESKAARLAQAASKEQENLRALAQTALSKQEAKNRVLLEGSKRAYDAEVLTLDQYLKVKETLLSESLAARTKIAIQERATLSPSNTVGIARAEAKIDLLNLETISLKGKINEERRKGSIKRAKVAEKDLNEELAIQRKFQDAVRETEAILARFSGTSATPKVRVDSRLQKQEEFIAAQVKAGVEGAKAEQKRLEQGRQFLVQEQFAIDMLKTRSDAEERYGFQRDLIQIKAQNGLATELDTLIALDSAKAGFVAREEVRITQLEAQLQRAPTTELASKIKDARQELILLKAESGQLETFLRGSLADAMSNAFTGYITGSQSALEATKSFVTGLLKEIARIAAQKLALQIIGGIIGGFTGLTARGGVFGQDLAPVRDLSTNFQPAATGGVTSGLSSAKNTVLSSPTFFPGAKVSPLASGGVVAGEAGSEAVLPLKRLDSGNLGVEALVPSTPGQTTGNVYNIGVTVESRKDEDSEDTGRKIAIALMKKIAKQEIAGANRPGNTLNKTTVFG